ncbi:MAG: hypothetical protein WCS73_07840 [Lentisphaeria bacterium]
MQKSLFDYTPAVIATGGKHASPYDFSIILGENPGFTRDHLPDFLQRLVTSPFPKDLEKDAIVPALPSQNNKLSRKETTLRATDFGVDSDPKTSVISPDCY